MTLHFTIQYRTAIYSFNIMCFITIRLFITTV